MTKVVDNYALLEVVGSGQYGNVYKARHMKTEHIYAVKCIRLEKFHKVPKLEEFTHNEITILSKLNNPHVIKFYERLKTANNLYLVYEFCSGGTLETHIFKKKRLGEGEAMKIFKQILMAFQSLVKENILHRDLKPGNILFHGELVKLADFGFCKGMTGPLAMTSTMVGSPIYMAPEILKGASYNTKADVWSLGVVLYEMLYGKCPFEERTIPRLLSVIQTRSVHFNHILNEVSSGTQDIIRGMLTVDANKRITWQQLFDRVLGRGGGIERPSFQAKNPEKSGSSLPNSSYNRNGAFRENERTGHNDYLVANPPEEAQHNNQLLAQPSENAQVPTKTNYSSGTGSTPFPYYPDSFGTGKTGLAVGYSNPSNDSLQVPPKSRNPGSQAAPNHNDFIHYPTGTQGSTATLPMSSNQSTASNPSHTMPPSQAQTSPNFLPNGANLAVNASTPSVLAPQAQAAALQPPKYISSFPQTIPAENSPAPMTFLGRLDKIMKNTSLMRELEKVANIIEEKRLGSVELMSILIARIKVQYTLHCIDFVMEIKDEDCRDQCIAIVYMITKRISRFWKSIKEQMAHIAKGKLASHVIDDEYFLNSLKREEEEFRRIEESLREEVEKGKDGVIAALPEFGREVITEDINAEFLLNIVVDVINNLKKQYDSEEVKYSFDFKYIILNHVCDLIVIDEVGETLLDPCSPMTEQPYFDSLKRLTKHELLSLVESKISLAYKENEADEEGRPHFGDQIKREEGGEREPMQTGVSAVPIYAMNFGIESRQPNEVQYNGYTL